MEQESIRENRKYYQRNKMLDIIRFHENVSRFDLKKMTSYSMTTVLNMVDDLIRQGFILEEESNEAKVGRKPTWLRINPDAGYFIGVEFNGREMHCDMLDFLGRVVYKASTETSQEDSANTIIEKISLNVQKAQDSIERKEKHFFGIGIGIPGYINKKEGVAVGYSYLRNWKNVPVKALIEKRFGIPCHIENNVNVMAFAYKYLYYKGDCEDFVFLSIRTGARIVPVMNNHMVFSDFGFSGEIGHIKISPQHNICTCGSFGCLNSEISDFAIPTKIREGIHSGRFLEINKMVDGNLDAITVGTFVESVKKNDKDSVMLMKEIAMYLGDAIGIVLNLYAPQKVIIYGELAKLGKVFIDCLYDNLKDSVIPENLDGFEIVVSDMEKDCGAIGAATLVMQEQFNFIKQTV